MKNFKTITIILAILWIIYVIDIFYNAMISNDIVEIKITLGFYIINSLAIIFPHFYSTIKQTKN